MKTYQVPTAKEQVIPEVYNATKSLFFMALLFTSFFATQAGVDWIDAYSIAHPESSSALILLARWTFILTIATANAFVMLGMGVLSHEGTHMILLRNRFLNDLLGGLMACLSFVPYFAERQFHLTHHKYTHQPGRDPENPMHHHKSYWYAVIFGMVIGLNIHYKIILSGLFSRPFNGKRAMRSLKDLAFLSFALFLYLYALPHAGVSPWITVLPSLILLIPVNSLRAMADHHALPPSKREAMPRHVLAANEAGNAGQRARDYKDVTSWIVLTNPLLEWLWSNINYHEIHHAYPYLSHRYTKTVFENTRHEKRYAVVHGYLRSLFRLRNRSYYGDPRDTGWYQEADTPMNQAS